MLRIDRVTPLSGWPGTLITIDGQDFSPTRDNNQVLIGGVQALVIRAVSNQLQVIAGEGTQSGFVEVRVSGSAPQIWPSRFEVSEWPDPRDARTVGPPVFFKGPQHSTPRVRQKNQRVLVILAHGKGDAPANPLLAAYEQSVLTENAGKFWREASYERTTFQFNYTYNYTDMTNWLELPQDRHAYVWDNTDIEWARREYLMWTKRHAVASGATLLAVHQGFKLTELDITNPSAPSERSGRSVSGLGTPMHVAIKGQIAYIASGDGIFVVNLAAPGGPAIVTKLTPPGRMMSCDVAGNLLAVAALDGGLHFYNIAAPAAPVYVATQVLDNWATTVRLTPGRAYVGVGTSVVIVHYTAVPFPPFPSDVVPAGAWVMGLDVSGTTCVAATDGDGLVIIDIGGVVPILRSKQLDILRLHAVTLSGTTAFAAAGDRGLHVVDVTNPAAPTTRSTLGTPRACYGVTIAGNRGWLSVGGKVFQPVDVTNPAAPVLGAEIDVAGTFVFGSDPNLIALRSNLTNARNSEKLSKGDRLVYDAIKKAHATSSIYDPAKYQGILVVILGPTGRGQSKVVNQIDDGGRDPLRFPEAKGVVWLPGDASWGRRAHEIGHWFGMRDIYNEALDDGTFIRGTATQWDMAGSHDEGPLFSGREALRMQLFEPNNVLTRKWTPSAAPYHEEFELAAHEGTEDTLTTRHHLLELVLAEKSLSYFVEVRRQGPPGLTFDQRLPIPPGASRVVVTRVIYENSTINNSTDQPTSLFGVLDVGQQVVDAARLLRIEVLGLVSNSPPTYRIKVTWNVEPDPDPFGKFDAVVTPWSTETWETPDIWVNSPRNDSGGAFVFDYHEPGDPSRPILNGDKPWVKRSNTVFGRVFNAGPADIHNVYVSFSTSSPPGIGDNGVWVTHDTRLLPVIRGNTAEVVPFVWEPGEDKHTCLLISVMPQQGERIIKNNKAQENVAAFDSRGGSSHEPVILEAEVRSPFSVGRKVDLRVAGLPNGWHAVIEPSWVWLEPKGSAPAHAIIWTDLHSPRAGGHEDIVAEAFPRVEGWTDFDHLYVPIGGILAPVRANAAGDITWELSAIGNNVHVLIYLRPEVAGVPVTVEVTNERGGRTHFGGVTAADGRMTLDFALRDGRYAAQVFTASTTKIAETESDVRMIRLPN